MTPTFARLGVSNEPGAAQTPCPSPHAVTTPYPRYCPPRRPSPRPAKQPSPQGGHPCPSARTGTDQPAPAAHTAQPTPAPEPDQPPTPSSARRTRRRPPPEYEIVAPTRCPSVPGRSGPSASLILLPRKGILTLRHTHKP